jgi:hypothetical protein
MSESLPFSAVRMETLQREMSAPDIRCLKESSLQVRRFLAVAQRIGFFDRSPDSDRVGYDIATHNLLPEAPLASLVHADKSSGVLGAFVNQWSARATDDPAKFIEDLILECERLGDLYRIRTDKSGKVGSIVAREELSRKLEEGKSIADLLSVLVDCAPPDVELPKWFQVMRRYELMPGDVEAILGWSIDGPNSVYAHIMHFQNLAHNACGA